MKDATGPAGGGAGTSAAAGAALRFLLTLVAAAGVLGVELEATAEGAVEGAIGDGETTGSGRWKMGLNETRQVIV